VFQQCLAVRCRHNDPFKERGNIVRHSCIAVCSIVLQQYVAAVCCSSVLQQCVAAVCCSALQTQRSCQGEGRMRELFLCICVFARANICENDDIVYM